MVSYYELFGISKDASAQEIRMAYHKAMRLYHPDLHGDQSDSISRIFNEAYAVLTNENRRREYDAKLSGSQVPAVADPMDRDFTASRTCKKCKGTGYVGIAFWNCEYCRGNGFVPGRKLKPDTNYNLCPECNGLGYDPIAGVGRKCISCKSAGWLPAKGYGPA